MRVSRTSYVFKDQDSWGIQTFTPPINGRGNDWVLVLVDAAAGFPITLAATRGTPQGPGPALREGTEAVLVDRL